MFRPVLAASSPAGSAACYARLMSAYIAAQQSWSQEPSRLGSLESALDRTTVRYLSQPGLRAGMLAAGEAVMTIGDAALQRAMRLTIERFATELVAAGRLAEAEVRACLCVMDEPDLLFTSSPMFSVWGRRAEHG